MKICLVVAASTNNVIGNDNRLLWHLPKDMRYFKNRTWAMPVIMGRKTFESLAGKALNGRLNIVITRQKDWQANGVLVANTVESAIALAKDKAYREVYIIGGAEIYAQTIAIAHTIYLTRVDTELKGDSFFPELSDEWKLTSQESFGTDAKHAYPFHFQVWEK